MSSLEVSDEIDSSDDEDNIIAKMETKSGLPQKGSLQAYASVNDTMLTSETAVATVTMSGGVMKRGGNLYDSSESESDEDDGRKSDRDNRSPSDKFDQLDTLPSTKHSSMINSDHINKTSASGSLPSAINSTNSTTNISPGMVSEITMNGKHSPDSTHSDTAVDKTPSVINNGNVIEEEGDRLSKDFKESRFNPFDRDLHVDEDYFEEKPKSHQLISDKINRIKSDSNASSHRTDDSHPVSENSDDVTFADLGLSEDHFSQPEGYFGLSSTEELEMAIETCKEMILVAQKGSDKQKNLVKTLIQLRLKLQELKEGPVPVDEGVKVVVGHKFTLRSGAGSKHYCEKCNTVIWGLVQEWYRCTDCGYSTHAKCLNLITRTCGSVKVQEDPTYCLSICPERGLSSQNYRCAECRGQISYKSGFSEPRMCDYSGNYYCELCHWNDTMLIPARVLHNWDFDEWKVCRASKQFLRLMETKAVIRIQDINPMLFSFVDELNEVKKFREELLIMKKYILICAVAMNEKLLLQLKSRQHFVESSDIYSMRDLIDVQKDALLPELAQVHSSWAQHIKTDCELCRAKGFICELCDQNEILFPFDNIALVCSECSYVLHRHCFAKRGGACPRCERRNKRKNN